MPQFDVTKMILILVAVLLIGAAIAYLVVEIVPIITETGSAAEAAFNQQYEQNGETYGSASSWWVMFARALLGSEGLNTLGGFVAVIVPAVFLLFLGMAIWRWIAS